MNPLDIRPVDPTNKTNAERIVVIQQSAYAVEAALMGFDGIPPLHETVAQVQALSDLQWLGAYVDQTLAGIIAWSADTDSIEIDRLAVDPAYSRQGIGRQLVAQVPLAATVVVSTGSLNAPALALYRQAGFAETGTTQVAPGIFTTQLQRSVQTPGVCTPAAAASD